MTHSQASAIISNIALDHGTGILEVLEYMEEIYCEGQEQWSEQFTVSERQAYWIVMEGMRELFFGK